MRAENEKTVLVYSEVPIRDVPVDGVLGPKFEWVEAIQKLCEPDDPITTSDVAREIGDGSVDTIRKRPDTKREMLAALAGVDLVGTKFVKR